MKTEANIFEQGLEEYPRSSVVLGNIAVGVWIAMGAVACWFLYPLIAWIYLAVAVLMVGIVLRKIVCTNCYYYGKRCGVGWGKLSALLFKQGEIDKFDTSIGLKIAPLTYGLLSLVPLICVIIALVQAFTVPKIVVLLLLLAISLYSGFISRKKGCGNCRMRLICPGSAVKGESRQE